MWVASTAGSEVFVLIGDAPLVLLNSPPLNSFDSSSTPATRYEVVGQHRKGDGAAHCRAFGVADFRLVTWNVLQRLEVSEG